MPEVLLVKLAIFLESAIFKLKLLCQVEISLPRAPSLNRFAVYLDQAYFLRAYINCQVGLVLFLALWRGQIGHPKLSSLGHVTSKAHL